MEVVRIDPEIMSGEPCFPGTRVPVQALVDYLTGGYTLEFFLIQYPTVSREKAEGFVQASADLAVAAVRLAARKSFLTSAFPPLLLRRSPP